MASAVVMPKLGWNMEAGSLVEWLKQEGDFVKAGEVIFTVESDKAVSEVEALEDGVLRIPADSPATGQQVPVGTVLAYLLDRQEAAEETTVTSPAAVHARDSATQPSNRPAMESPTDANKPTAVASSPRARRVAAELGVTLTELRGSGHDGRIVECDVRRAAVTFAEEVRASPLARRLAEDAGIDLRHVTGTGPGARVTREDVEAAIRESSAAGAEPGLTEAAPLGSVEATKRVPLSAVRRVVRDRMLEASRGTASVTLMADADAIELVALRTRLVTVAQASAGKLSPPTYNDLFVRLVGCALEKHPELNASLDGDTLVLHGEVHMGLAVDTPRGLLVPVIRDASRRGIWAIAADSARLVEGARAGSLAPDELRGSTFTITNLGSLDIRAFTPILNLPECAVLGIGKIERRAVVNESGEVVARQTVTLSLTFDHRAVDGAPAARFLQTVRRYVEEPLLWLAG